MAFAKERDVESTRTALCVEPPDLLKRFVPTPFRANLRMGSLDVVALTNDPAILRPLTKYQSHSRRVRGQFVWKLIRDDGVQEPLLEPTIVHERAVTFVSMGPACLMAVDYENRELFTFIGLSVDVSTFTVSVLPLMSELTQRSAAEATEESERRLELVLAGGQNAQK